MVWTWWIGVCGLIAPMELFIFQAKKEESSEESESEDGSGGSGSESGSESGSDAEGAKKGKAPITEIENPNRIAVKKVKKVGEVDTNQVVEPVLSRREREEIEKQRAAEHYRHLHAQGKTDEARADLARLAIIRQQREEAAKKRDEEKRRQYFLLIHLHISTLKLLSSIFLPEQ